MHTAIIVHGGAGSWSKRDNSMPRALEACREAARHAQVLLLQGATALDAVEAATRILEDCPVLDAGRGSYLNRAGDVEMDALIMDGETLSLGAVGAIQRVRNPISLARRIMDECDHTFLVGAGASAFAEDIGFPRCTLDELLTPAQRERLRRMRREGAAAVVPGEAMGTVGAVALDSRGNLAAAVSTGGTDQKMPGRIGDSPMPGSGAYADNWTAAAVATGKGESLMKIVISRRICELVSTGLSAADACEGAIRILGQRVQGEGGVIAIDARGNVGHAYNTEAMPHAYAIGDNAVESGQ